MGSALVNPLLNFVYFICKIFHSAYLAANKSSGMKQFSFVLNIVLLIAVAFLYYLHFAGSKKLPIKTASAFPVTHDTVAAKGIVVAYVELDSLNSNVNFIRQRKKELEAEQRVIANEYENAYRELTAQRDNFLKRGNAITQQEAEAFQEKLGLRQQEIEQTKQQKGQKLAEKGARIMEDMQGKLKDFMNEYNKEKMYTMIFTTGTGLDYLLYKDSTLNITSDIVKGLNIKMK
jgi:outer membrane protein